MSTKVIVDFETHGIEPAPNYPPRPVGLAYQMGSARQYMAWGHPIGNNCSEADAKKFLRSVWKQELVWHNAMFDVAVARTWWKFGAPPRCRDTLVEAFLVDPTARSLALKPLSSRLLELPPLEQTELRNWILTHVAGATPKNWGAFIAQAPGQLVGRYAKGDVLRTAKLHRLFSGYIREEGLEECYDVEIALQPIVMEMEREGVRIDRQRLLKDTERWRVELLKLESYLTRKLGNINFNSGAQLSNALMEVEEICDDEWPLTPKGQRSTSRSALAKMVKNRRLLDRLHRHSTLSHMLSNFCEPWLARMDGYDQERLFPRFNAVRERDNRHTGTRSGRFSSDDPCFQQLNRKPADSSMPYMRNYVLPEPGHVLLGRDFDQQELRILAHFEQGALFRAYLDNPKLDVHDYTKQQIKEFTGQTWARSPVKITGFRIVYGGGAKAVAAGLDVEEEEGKRMRDTWLAANPGVAQLMRRLKDEAEAGQPVLTRAGRIYYPTPNKGYVQLNRQVQGSAADHTKRAMLKIHRAVKKYGARMLLTVHDEILLTCPAKHAADCDKAFKRAMEFRYFDLPTPTTGAVGTNWGSMIKESA